MLGRSIDRRRHGGGGAVPTSFVFFLLLFSANDEMVNQKKQLDAAGVAGNGFDFFICCSFFCSFLGFSSFRAKGVLVLPSFYRVLLTFTEFDQVLPSFTELSDWLLSHGIESRRVASQ